MSKPNRLDTYSSHASTLKRKKYRGKLTQDEIIEFPSALDGDWSDPHQFHLALNLHMKRHGDTCGRLFRAVVKPDENFDFKTIWNWRHGRKSPRTVVSMAVLARIEQRYRLPVGYFKNKLPHRARAATGHALQDIGPAERRRLAWHLPDDYNTRSESEQQEILEWVQRVIITGSTEYRRFQANALRHRYAIRFPHTTVGDAANSHDEDFWLSDIVDPETTGLPTRTIAAPAGLATEMHDLIRFKTSTLTAVGLQRSGVWGEATAQQKIEHLGLMFGALAAAPKCAVRGLGVPLQSLTFGLLVFPSVWDWYVRWRERRRGFYTAWEIDMLRVALALTRQETGWIRQHPQLALKLAPIKGLISKMDVAAARSDWNDVCDRLHKHATIRVKEIERVAKVHRDPFEPILAILEADSPLAEYRKIADEVLRLMPDENRFPVSAAEAVRSYLLLRLGMHTGLRQKNLRQLLFCPRGMPNSSERQLMDRKRGELRWSERENGWELFIPAISFKNANSSYFGNKPFRLRLPDLGGLYAMVDAYVERHRVILLRNAPDPGTFFVKTMKSNSEDAAYNQNTFYEAWRLTIQRYGIFNPYTERGAIKGLLPHGPHSIRDVLATHVLKQTGSYEQASYAIQDTPDMVAKHYGRFLPQDKAAMAAQILNKVWEVA